MKVLVVDNSAVFQRMVASFFSRSELKPVAASSANKCLELIHNEQFEFICVSLHLDTMNGIGLCKKIRQTELNIYTPVILFTTEISSEIQKQGVVAGITEIFNKTTDLDKLVAYIERFSMQHKPINGKVLYIED